MTESSFRIPQLLLRYALGIGFLTPVADRFGLLGSPDSGNVSWGNWANFIDYTATLMPVFERPTVNILGGIATAFEIIIAICLIIGLKTKYAALGASLITLVFTVFMIFSVGILKPIYFGVCTASAAGFLLSVIPKYRWSVDYFLGKK